LYSSYLTVTENIRKVGNTPLSIESSVARRGGCDSSKQIQEVTLGYEIARAPPQATFEEQHAEVGRSVEGAG